MIRRIGWGAALLVCLCGLTLLAPPMTYEGVTFPSGDVAFADRVVEYIPASCVSEDCDDPREALGPPDAGCPGCVSCGGIEEGTVSLGSRISPIDERGWLTLEFVDNVLADVAGADLYVFITNGRPVEVEISMDGISYLSLGTYVGCPAAIDISAFATASDEFRFVRLIDVPADEGRADCSGASVDAVGAMGPEIVAEEGEVSGSFALQPMGRLLLETPARSDVFLILFDTTSSMATEIDGVRKIDIARDAIIDFLDRLPAATTVGFRAFASCGRNRVISTLDEPLPIPEIQAQLLLLEPGGATPLAYTLEQASVDCGCIAGPKTIVLISDGIETCHGDPIRAAEELARAEEGVVAHVIGFNAGESISDRGQLIDIATALGGQYHDAEDADELNAVLRVVGSYIYRLYDAEGTVAFEGRTGDGGPGDLAAGTYRLVIDSVPSIVVDEVVVTSEGSTRIILDVVNGQLVARVIDG